METERWVWFKSAYGVTSFYCMPGKEGAHEKGGVEGEGGRFRRRWFVPIPKIADISGLAAINEKLAAADLAENSRHIDHRTTTIGQDFVLEAPVLAPLPVDEFDIALATTPRGGPATRQQRRTFTTASCSSQTRSQSGTRGLPADVDRAPIRFPRRTRLYV